MKIKRLLAINVPIKNCNLKCKYCYISALNQSQCGAAKFKYSPKHVGKCLSIERLGGPCIINLTGGGETLIPKEMPEYIFELLKQGHCLEVVTNGTLTERFKRIVSFPKEYLSRLEFKFSFHYLELKRKNWLDKFIENVYLVKNAGCSFTIELMPSDEIINDIPDIINLCQIKFGAKCHITVGRNDLTNNLEFLTEYSPKEYESIWKVFESEMFNFKINIFKQKRKEFCYAGAWSLYIDLGTGNTKQCYGQLITQNIFQDPDRKIIFRPVGFHCRQPYCYNGHAFLTVGCIPELETPTYAEIRNRVTATSEEWLREPIKIAFSQKLKNNNKIWSEKEKKEYEYFYIFRFIKDIMNDLPEVGFKIKERLRRY